uniref:Amine oxidase domain-containing protein n=1 Tax=Biomphalaria glabrata TaxID=6526 RepID=A0A2C9K765_BIOGL
MSANRKRILIVGAGASGIAAAYSLGKHAEKFEVHIWDKSSFPGGVATTEPIEGPGNLRINDGVQGGCPTYRNTLNLMAEFGLATTPVKMMISFGKGPTFWTNHSTTELIRNYKEEIKRFGGTLRLINKLEFFFIFVPISLVLNWFGYSKSFCYEMVFPLTALFFGTGNQTPNVSAAIVARVFLDDDLRLFDYDPENLLSQTPEMFAFPYLRDMYEKIVSGVTAAFHRERQVSMVTRRQGKVYAVDDSGKEEVFDEIIFACDAESVLKVLKSPTYLERKALGNVRYYNDVTITHEDDEYMTKHYELIKNLDQYFIRTDSSDPSKLEMSFNLSNYQPHLKSSGRNIYQTIFLDDSTKDIWTIDEIKKDKIRFTRWWRQFSHTWRHFAFTVPVMRFLQGKNNTWYAGSYTLINTHEIAVISGLAAAHRIGADYPFAKDELARKQFEQYLLMIHGKPRKYGLNLQTAKSMMLAPFMVVFVAFTLMVQFCFRFFDKH